MDIMTELTRHFCWQLFYFFYLLKAGFHTCVSRKHNDAQCLSIHGPQCSEAIPAFATKSHMLSFCRDMLSLWPIETDKPGHKTDFLSSEKKSKVNKKYNDDFQIVVISNSIPDALHDLHTSKCKRPRSKPNDGCLWKPAKRNNNCTSKQLWFVAH